MSTAALAAALLVVLGLGGAFLSGLLGLGGAVVLIPLLLYVPPLLGLPPFGMAEVAGMSIVLVLASAATGLVTHHRAGAVDWRAVAPMMATTGLGAALGGVLSGQISDGALRAVFAVLALIAVVLMLAPSRADAADEGGEPAHRPRVALGAGLAGAVGVVSGMIGAGGAFVMLPLMRTALAMPTRKAIASSLALVLVAAALGVAAKAATGQVPWGWAAWLVLGGLVGAPLGARLSRRVSVPALRWLLAGLIGLVAMQMLASVVLGRG